jgi:hypothetical protein
MSSLTSISCCYPSPEGVKPSVASVMLLPNQPSSSPNLTTNLSQTTKLSSFNMEITLPHLLFPSMLPVRRHSKWMGTLAALEAMSRRSGPSNKSPWYARQLVSYFDSHPIS